MANEFRDELITIYDGLPRKSTFAKTIQRNHPVIYASMIEYWHDGHSVDFRKFVNLSNYYINSVNFQCDCGNFKNIRTIFKPPFCNSACQHTKDKRKSTVIDKFGVEYPAQDPELLEKMKQTNLNKYGVDIVSKLQLTKDKMKATNVEKYGVEYVSQVGDFRDKIISTSMERYGADSYSKTDEAKIKMKASNMEKYGVEYTAQVPSIIQTIQYSKRSSRGEGYHGIIDPEIMRGLYEAGGTRLIRETFNVSSSTANVRLRACGVERTSSSLEAEIVAVIKKYYSGPIIYRDRIVLEGKELDLLLPELGLAFECNGAYWHSELNGKDKNYHLAKTLGCEGKNIRLLHIWEHEWLRSPDKIESLIASALGSLPRRIHARKCEVVTLKANESIDFLNVNHRQSSVNGSHRYGLVVDGELVAAMVFGKARYTKSYEYELLRYSSLLGVSVVGGASRLLAKFISDTGSRSIISYCDRSLNTGGMYGNIGFELISHSPPSYYYSSNRYDFFHRTKFQKHKLAGLLPNFDDSLTEWENMQANGYDRIWNCGNSVWALRDNLKNPEN